MKFKVRVRRKRRPKYSKPSELEEKARSLICYGRDPGRVASLFRQAAEGYRKCNMPARGEQCDALARKYELRNQGILDLREFGIGMWRGRTRLNPVTLEPMFPKEERKMATVKKARTTNKSAASKKAPVAKKEAADAKKEKGGGLKGRTSGLGIRDTWVDIFQKNEKLPKAKKMTDDDISKYMKSEFVGRNTKAFDRVSAIRARYNRGVLTQGVIPSIQSRAYDKDGSVIEGRKKREKAPAKSKAKAKAKVPTKAKAKTTKAKMKVRRKKTVDS